jgi:hypothetical protein
VKPGIIAQVLQNAAGHVSHLRIGIRHMRQRLAATNAHAPIDHAEPIRHGRARQKLNYYRLEAGRFEDFVSYGLKSFAHEGVT